MNRKSLALGILALALVGAAAWLVLRPSAVQRGAEGPGGTTTSGRGADPRVDLARPDGSVEPDARTARPTDDVPPPTPAAGAGADVAATSAPSEAGAPISVDQVTDETRVFAEKYREASREARSASLLVLESVIAERLATGDFDPAGKGGPSLADLKAEAEWLRTHPEG